MLILYFFQVSSMPGTIQEAAVDGKEGKADWDELLETRATFFRRNCNEDHHGYLDYSTFSQASLQTPLPDHNRGMKLLLKMGWSKDTGLGKNRTGWFTIPVA